ncbi:hypothetical protein TcYC6_0104840 [Trypanosoma cruzi]|nr:hypothetical protein TcYC6_0104840 [Trypanosoma cruzi]
MYDQKKCAARMPGTNTSTRSAGPLASPEGDPSIDVYPDTLVGLASAPNGSLGPFSTATDPTVRCGPPTPVDENDVDGRTGATIHPAADCLSMLQQQQGDAKQNFSSSSLTNAWDVWREGRSVGSGSPSFSGSSSHLDECPSQSPSLSEDADDLDRLLNLLSHFLPRMQSNDGGPVAVRADPSATTGRFGQPKTNSLAKACSYPSVSTEEARWIDEADDTKTSFSVLLRYQFPTEDLHEDVKEDRAHAPGICGTRPVHPQPFLVSHSKSRKGGGGRNGNVFSGTCSVSFGAKNSVRERQ